VPAAAVRQNPQALSGFIGRKGSVGGLVSLRSNTPSSTWRAPQKRLNLRALGADGTVGVGVKSVDIDRNTESEGIQLGRP
jgi:hypothetical protein